MQIYKFRNCLLNTFERAVIKETEYIDLTAKTFDVLQFLIENAGRAVTKDEILGEVWSGNFVEESNLPVHISKLRKLLGESGESRFIETIQGTGYRFIAPISAVAEDEWEKRSSPATHAAQNASRSGNCIAVLPLQNDTLDSSKDYLSDGLTEGLINGLSHIAGLRVIARNTVFRYKDTDCDITDIGNQLGSSRIVTGRIRLTSEDLIVGVELVNSDDGTQIWGAQYERKLSDLVSLQQEIISELSGRLTRSQAGPDTIRPTEDAESYRLHLMGNYFLAKKTAPGIYKAIECFQRSVSCSPTNIHSYVAIVEAFRLLHLLDYISREEVLRNINPFLNILSSLDDSIDVVQLMQGKLKFQLHWDSGRAEQHFHNALELNPNLVDAHPYCAEIMILRGESSLALNHANQILALDPMSLITFKRVARVFYGVGMYNEAFTYLNYAYEMESSDFETLVLIGAVLTETGDLRSALWFLRKSFSCHENADTLAMIGYVKALAGRNNEAHQIIKRIKSEVRSGTGHSIKLARIYTALGEKEKAYEYLERAYREQDVDMCALSYDPRWKGISTEPRFLSMIERVGILKGLSSSST